MYYEYEIERYNMKIEKHSVISDVLYAVTILEKLFILLLLYMIVFYKHDLARTVFINLDLFYLFVLAFNYFTRELVTHYEQEHKKFIKQMELKEKDIINGNILFIAVNFVALVSLYIVRDFSLYYLHVFYVSVAISKNYFNYRRNHVK